jgi:hypothetical protein
MSTRRELVRRTRRCLSSNCRTRRGRERDPFGIPPALAVGYDRPLSLLEQFLSGEQSGGRTTFMLPFRARILRDLGIALAGDSRS